MDILKTIFLKFSRRQHAHDKERRAEQESRFDENLISLKTLISFVLSEASPPIFSGNGIGRVGVHAIYLPETIDFLPNQELNHRILIHKALASAIIQRDSIHYSKNGLSYSQRSIEILQSSAHIKIELGRLFPQFFVFHEELCEKLCKFPNENLKMDSNAIWQEFPLKTLALWVELKEKSNFTPLRNSSTISSDNKNNAPQTELPGNSSTEQAQEVLLKDKKNQENPIHHSFEKIEAIDEYNGGLRAQDAEDELESHADALEELNLRHLTREGGGTGSIFKGGVLELFGFNPFSAPAPRYPIFHQTPEWDFRTKNLQANHCRLYLLEEIARSEKSRTDFLAKLQKEYPSEISNWSRKIAALVLENSWKDRQFDGPEWSIDAYAKYCADIKSCGYGDPKLFIQRRRQKRDLQVTILMDHSLSSDSWVLNRRVLDIQLESVGLCGLILNSFYDQVSVLSTWSETRHHCYLQKLKDFGANWDAFFESVDSISPRGYTRLGPAIREAANTLASTPARRKLLILMTDGRPTDLDHYEGAYGTGDMQHAILEAEQLGIHVQALAIDSEAKKYFPQIFSPGKYHILSSPKLLPEHLFKIYADALNS